MTYAQSNQPTGYSDDDGVWITKTEYIARYVLPMMKPAVRKAFDMMLDGFILFVDGRTNKYTLRRGDEIMDIRRPVADNISRELLENHGEYQQRGEPDLYGNRKVWKSYAWRLNHQSKEAAK